MTDEVQAELDDGEEIEQNELVENEDSEATADNEELSEGEQEADKELAQKAAVQKRIDELTREKYKARREAEQARQEVEQLRNMSAKEISEHPEAVKELVIREAERIAAEKVFNDACNTVYAKGKAELGESFDSAVQGMQMVGMSREFLEIVSSMDSNIGYKVISQLGSDLDEAARIASLPPVQMTRELTKLEVKLSKPQKTVSGAPEPIKHISGNKATASKNPERMTFQEKLDERRARVAARSR